jgi:hypothetical protein
MELNATTRLEGSCPICAGIEGCDHTVPERVAAAFPKSKRLQWMGEYEQELVKLQPHMRGKVDWDAASYYFLQGIAPKEAAQKHAHAHS